MFGLMGFVSEVFFLVFDIGRVFRLGVGWRVLEVADCVLR